MPRSRDQQSLHVGLWIAQIVLAIFFALAGFVHGLLPIAQTAKSAPWAADLPVLLVKFIGTAEIAGAIGLIVPAAFRVLPVLTPLAAVGLATITALAVPFHLSRGETRIVNLPLILCALAMFVAWGRSTRARIDRR
jgi:hypothetical protein